MQTTTQVESQSNGKVQQLQTQAAPPQRWSLIRRLALLFSVVYFPLYTLWVPVHFIPIPPIPQLFDKYQVLRRVIVVWVGEGLLHLQVRTGVVEVGNGSKDTMYNWVELLCYVVLAAAFAVIWSVLDRKRPNYERLQQWFLLYMRLVLGTMLIQYGVAKIFPAQFPAPTLSTLVEPYGDSSPMHLLWTFMGASPIYTFFAGAVEVLGGALLFIPRTRLLGALISLGAMGNVLMLNLGYDVAVKIGSITMVCMAIILIVPDLRRLFNFFLFNQRVDPAPEPPLFQSKRLNQAALVLQLVFCFVLVAHNLYADRHSSQAFLDYHVKAPLYGIWSVDEFSLDGQVRPPLLTDEQRWQRIIVDSNDTVWVQSMNGQPVEFRLRVDPQRKSLRMARSVDSAWRADFAYENPQTDQLLLTGQLDGHPVTVTLRRMDESKFLLINRGFHWVNEFSLNR